MAIDSAESLIQALRASGLFTPEQLMAVVRELAPLGNDPNHLMRHLVAKGRLTVYQLRKIVHKKAADLFLGDYVIAEKLGEGGMGKVYRARQTRIGREVALKVVRPALLAKPLMRKRYLREVETVSALSHPNIVSLYDAGEAGGVYYLAMEFVDGVDLARLVRDHQPLEIPEACEYARQVALGLQHAHDAGFVHRDIKPSNIVVAGERHLPQAAGRAVVKILDLGLVRAVGIDLADDGQDVTRDGTVVGTPDYMAPEQAKNSSTVDHRADLYSLGCTLYFLLAGRPPFPEGSSIEKLLKHQLDPPPSVRTLRPDVPDPVAAVVARLLAKKPDQRFASADEVAAALAPLARYPDGSQPVSVRLRRTDPAVPPTPAAESHPAASGAAMAVAPAPVAMAEPVAPDELVPLAQPVSPSDPTPRPGLPPAPIPQPASPFEALNEPPSGPHPVVRDAEPAPHPPAPPGPRPPWVWVASAAGVVAVGVGLWLAFGSSTPRPTPGTQPTTHPEPQPRPTPPKPNLTPNVNLARLLPQASLIPDGSALVVVAYPSVYLRDKDSPFSRGVGPNRLAQWVGRLGTDTALPLGLSERVILTVPAESNQYLLASEGDYLNRAFIDALDRNPRLRPLGAKVTRPVKLYGTTGGRVTALFSPPGAQVYVVASAPGFLERPLGQRLFPGLKGVPAPDLAPGMLPALAAAAEPPLPLLFAAAGPKWRLPLTDSPNLGDHGVELLTFRLRMAEKAELELAVTTATEAAATEFLAAVSEAVREQYPIGGVSVADLLARAERTGEEVGDKYRTTLKTALTPELWSNLLDKLLRE